MHNIERKVCNMSNNELINKNEYGVKYPSKERAYAFIPHNKIPFESAIVGETYPFPGYEINRSENTKICLFEYIVSGEGEVFVGGRWQYAKAGDFYILPSGQKQHYRSSSVDPWRKIWINYTAPYMESFLSAYGIVGGIYRSESVRVYFDELTFLAKTDDLSENTAFKIADRIHRIVRCAALNREETEDEWGMRRLLCSYVYKKLNLDEFAEKMHMSKSNVIRLYKKKYGITPYEELIRMKIEAAKTLLGETSLPIKEIAAKVCITDEHYFSSLFLERTGIRPGSYRKDRKNGV